MNEPRVLHLPMYLTCLHTHTRRGTVEPPALWGPWDPPAHDTIITATQSLKALFFPLFFYSSNVSALFPHQTYIHSTKEKQTIIKSKRAWNQ